MKHLFDFILLTVCSCVCRCEWPWRPKVNTRCSLGAVHLAFWNIVFVHLGFTNLARVASKPLGILLSVPCPCKDYKHMSPRLYLCELWGSNSDSLAYIAGTISTEPSPQLRHTWQIVNKCGFPHSLNRKEIKIKSTECKIDAFYFWLGDILKNQNIFQFTAPQTKIDKHLAILKAVLSVSPLQNDPEKMDSISYGETYYNFLSF